MEYERRIKIQGRPALEEARTFLSLVECYKIIHGLNAIDQSNCFEITYIYYNLRRPYSITLKIASTRIDFFKIFILFTRFLRTKYFTEKNIL